MPPAVRVVRWRVVLDGPQPPARLVRFVADEWSAPPVKESATDWERQHWNHLGRVHAWRDARRVWSAKHGDALGDYVERLIFERAARRALIETIKEHTHGLNGQCG